MQTMSTIWRDNRPHYISMPNIDKKNNITSESNTLRQTSGMISPHQNKEQSLRVYQCMSTDSFKRTAQNPVERSPLIFYLWRHVGTFKNHDAVRFR